MSGSFVVTARWLAAPLVIAGCRDAGSSDTQDCADAECPCDDDAQCTTTTATETFGTVSTSGSDGTASSGGTSADDDASDGVGSTGAAAPFSVLPPYDVLGAQWAYENEDLQSGNTYDLHCTISELFEWPDQQPGSSRACVQNGTPLQDARYALYPDRIERRENGTAAFDPPVDLFRIPLDVGDTWELEYRFAGMSPVMETWTVIAGDPIELAFGTFDAVEIEFTSGSAAGTAVTTTWWVDGIGTVKSVTDTTALELVSFALP